MTCTFFGHHDAPSALLRELNKTIETAIREFGADHFLLGNQGNFDQMSRLLLNTFVKDKHPDIRYEVVLAYMPGTNPGNEPADSCATIYPEELEHVPPCFAIVHRNKWMVDHSDIVICCVRHSWGGAAKALEYAKKKDKIILNICDAENLTK